MGYEENKQGIRRKRKTSIAYLLGGFLNLCGDLLKRVNQSKMGRIGLGSTYHGSGA
jgi:hypothetical protein